ncbi:peptidyl-prolyl cis-trans isomerase FKBP4 [Exaiptasia diaphana]|uniref:peptidylprolyl isomerase n=1 Tax=Exaiptasia diaphana TaxID=2652724 RepID=A0A913Y281_EXADI|nr:peptidyl-prolyl cis-trans isomerase FKBP4 [Exaiptasia diaphana]KXJ23190.1 Peptidyl-prolyl cis-trans isomerase FKBP4 [Exaiptasia diaphana]
MSPTSMETAETSASPAQNNEEEMYGVDLTESKDGGVRKVVLCEGTGLSTVPTGSVVSVKYIGKFMNGDEFDSNIGGEPFKFVLGQGVVIRGWDISIPTMKLHEKSRITVQPQYGYGKLGGSKIPPNSILQFDIEIVCWKGTSVTKDGEVTKIVLVKGEGYDRPNTGAQIEVHLTGKYDGKVFEDRDVAFTFGEGSEVNVLDGVEAAIGQMVNKETADVRIEPGKFGFGPNGNPEFGIPGDATLEYQIVMKNMEKLSEAWELTNDEKIATALRMKDKGTKFFKEGKHKIACQQYAVVVKMLDGYFDEEELKKTNPIKVAGHLNLAACHLKLGNNFKCIKACEKALGIDKENIKALFRRGKARLALKDYSSSKSDFLAVLSLDPKNREAREQLRIVNQNLKIQNAKDKKTFANMFERLAEKDDKNKPTKDVFSAAVEEANLEEARIKAQEMEQEANS